MTLRRLLLLALVLACAAPTAASAQGADDEPNDLVRQASGPLAGGVDHAGRLTGRGDRDWFVFYAAEAGDIEVLLTNTSTEAECTLLNVTVLDTDAEAVVSFGMQPGEARRAPVTASGHERYYVRLDAERGCARGASYVVRLQGPVTTEAPAGLRPPACQDARDRLTLAQRALRRARATRNRRRIAAARRRVAAARRAVARSC